MKPPQKKNAQVGTTVANVRKLALALSDTVERPSYGTPGFRVKDRLFARVLDEEQVVVRVDLAWRDDMVLGLPAVFSVTDHYRPHPWVVVNLREIGKEQLEEVLVEAHRLMLEKK